MNTTMFASRRKVLVGAGATAAALTLAACGKSSESSGAVTITYWHRLPDKDGMTKVDDIIATWNKENPDIQVKATKFAGAVKG